MLGLILFLHFLCLFPRFFIEQLQVDVEIVDSAFELFDDFLAGSCLLFQLRASVSLEAKFAYQLFTLLYGI